MIERDPAEWDVEIEADFRRFVAADRAAAAAARGRKEKERFVKVPLWWIEQAAKLTRSPTTLVLVELLYAKFRTGSSTFTLSNARLQKLGVSREIKHRVLRALSRTQGRLLVVEQEVGKAPRVSLIGL
jgi:hypothetical protein